MADHLTSYLKELKYNIFLSLTLNYLTLYFSVIGLLKSTETFTKHGTIKLIYFAMNNGANSLKAKCPTAPLFLLTISRNKMSKTKTIRYSSSQMNQIISFLQHCYAMRDVTKQSTCISQNSPLELHRGGEGLLME